MGGFQSGTIPAPPMVSPSGAWGFGLSMGAYPSLPSSGSWATEAANRAVYLPLVLPAACICRRVWWVNGATVSGGATIEVGVYASSGYAPGAKLVSGSAVQGSANAVQFVDVTDSMIPSGLIWIAIMASSTTNTYLFRINQSDVGYRGATRMQQASANPLPATATPVEATAMPIWLCGFATTASP